MLLKELLEISVKNSASDLHLVVGVNPIIRVNGELVKLGDDKLTPEDTQKYAMEMLHTKYEEYDKIGDVDLSYSIGGLGRFRVNIFKQRGSDSLAIRTIKLNPPTLDELDMPNVIKKITEKQRGLILVTGPTGSGKSTTLAAMINEINRNTAKNIITLEDPIEFLHKHDKCIINQREIGKDTISFKSGLRSALREDPDVILVGEIRDWETMAIATTAAETGHLVFSTLHTIGASKTIDRIVDIFPYEQQKQIKVQLATSLQGIVSQQLLPTLDGNGRVAALEIMVCTSAIQNLIREGKNYQIDSCVQTGAKYGMKTMDMSIAELYRKKIIDEKIALNYSVDKDSLKRMISMY
jgi:twitching motility protein PilT